MEIENICIGVNEFIVFSTNKLIIHIKYGKSMSLSKMRLYIPDNILTISIVAGCQYCVLLGYLCKYTDKNGYVDYICNILSSKLNSNIDSYIDDIPMNLITISFMKRIINSDKYEIKSI